MSVRVQHLRTTSATALPAGLKPGEIAFSLANKWMMVGIAGNDIVVAGNAIPSAQYGTTQTIYGTANVALPSKIAGNRPATGAPAQSLYDGEGYEIFDLEGGGASIGPTAPTAAGPGQLWVDTSVPALPVLKVYDGSAFVTAAPASDWLPKSATPPAAPSEGQVYVSTANAGAPVVMVYRAGAWAPLVVPGVVPVGTSAPAGVAGQTWIDTSGARPLLKIWDPAANAGAGGFVAPMMPLDPPKIYSLTTAEAVAGTPTTSPTTRFNGALAGKDVATADAAAMAAKLKSGDTLVITGASQTVGVSPNEFTAAAGAFIWDGTSWLATGGSTPNATTTVRGSVLLARDTDVSATGTGGATSDGADRAVTAAQLRALEDRLAGMVSGSALLGTYDGSTGLVASLTPTAGADGRGGMVAPPGVATGVAAATGLKEGDFLVVAKGGTPPAGANEPAEVAVALNPNDHLVWTGTKWHVIASGLVQSASSIHGASDVSDGALAVVNAADQKGVLVRDSSVAADGSGGAYKLVEILDLGTF